MTTELNNPASIANEISKRMSLLRTTDTASIRTLRREHSKRLAQSPARFVIKIALQLLKNKTELHRFVGYELVNQHRLALCSMSERDLKQFGDGINSWGAVDMFGCFLSGPVWREYQVKDNLIHRWTRSKDRWWRRAALVSTVPLNSKARGGTGDTRRTLEICQLLVDDRDDMVIKALSWALRELAKRDPTAVREFLKANQHALAARVIREVKNKLSTGLKNPRLRRASNTQ